MTKVYNEMAEGVDGPNDESNTTTHSGNNGIWNGGPNITNENTKNSENGKEKEPVLNGNYEDKVCRDFLRKVCKRGNRCKFLHPKDEKPTVPSSNPNKRDVVFCRDFRNGFCPRTTCRFIHCAADEEDRYLNSGQLLPHLLEQAIYKGQILDTTQKGEAPICKDFIMGECLRKRGGKCRFRHLTKSEYKQELYGSQIGLDSDPRNNSNFDGPPLDNCGMLPDAKRQRFDSSLPLSCDRDFMRSMDDSRVEMFSRDMSLREFRDRERELDRERDRRGLEEILLLRNQLETLKKEIVVLKKENSDLRATNDFLLEKITTLGMTKGGGTVTTVTVPTVSLASTIPVASVQPLTAAQVSHPLSITSEGCSVGSVVTMPAVPTQPQAPPQSLAPPTQMAVAPPPTAVLGPVGGVQVTLSQALAPNAVSLSTVNLSSMAPQTSIAPSLTPSLVTYPIMTQPGLRQQMQ